jgi:cytochrome c-type biogenesis protein CcmH
MRQARGSARLASLLAIAGALALAASVPATAAEPRASLPDIEDEVMCPICGTLLAHSEAPQAERERALIRKLIERGESKEEIKDALVAEYGPRVLATPSGEGFDLLAWLVPGTAILLAAGAVVYGLRRVLREASRRRLEPEPLDPDDAAKLDADMRRHDL